MEFKDENEFKKWLIENHFKNYDCHCIESRNNLGFPDVICSPKQKNRYTVFFEAKYIREDFKKNKSYKIAYRPKQYKMLKILGNDFTISKIIICFNDGYIVSEPCKELNNDSDYIFIYFKGHPFINKLD